MLSTESRKKRRPNRLPITKPLTRVIPLPYNRPYRKPKTTSSWNRWKGSRQTSENEIAYQLLCRLTDSLKDQHYA